MEDLAALTRGLPLLCQLEPRRVLRLTTVALLRPATSLQPDRWLDTFGAVWSAALTLCTALSAAPGDVEAAGAILVRAFESDPSLEALAKATADEVIVALGRAAPERVIGERELSLMFDQAAARAALEACDGPECDTAPLQASDVSRLVTGRLSRLGGQYVLSLKLSDLRTASFAAGESCIVEDDKALLACARRIGAALIGARSARVVQPRLRGARLAVLPLDISSVSPDVGTTLTELLLLEAKRMDGVAVISQQEVRAMLEFEAERQIVNCENNVTCLLEIGGALKADFILGGGIAKLDDTFIFHLKLMDIKKGEVTRRESESLVGDERELAAVVRVVARRLFGAEVDGHGGLQVLLEGDEEDARVSIDGAAGIALQQVSTATLAPGKHAISIRADGFQPLHREFFVEAGTRTSLRSTLTPLPSNWYEEWWVWAVAGTVVVAAASGVAIAASRGGPTGGDVGGVVPFPFD